MWKQAAHKKRLLFHTFTTFFSETEKPVFRNTSVDTILISEVKKVNFTNLRYERSCSKVQIRDLGKKENGIGAEPVHLMLCAIFNLIFKQQTTINKNVKFLISLQRT